MSEQANNPFERKPKLSADETAWNFASNYLHEDRRLAHLAWKKGYYFGHNEMMERFQQYIACQPPPPIKINADEMSIENYKGFLSRKINKDSKGSWWAKVKLWYKFLIS